MELAQMQNLMEQNNQRLLAEMQAMLNRFKDNTLVAFSNYDKKYTTGWLTTDEFAAECKITKDAVRARIRAGKITKWRQASKNSTILICVTELKKTVG